MKKSLFLFSTLTLALTAAEESGYLNNSFTLYGDFAYLKREQSNKHKLIIDTSSIGCNCKFPSCNTEAMAHHFDFEPGFKVGVTYTTPHTLWDFFYLWVNPWKVQCSRSNPGNLYFSIKNPNITTDFSGADSGFAEYGSEFQNAELNYYRYVSPRQEEYFSSAWMVGLRYVNLKEDLHVSMINGGDQSSYIVHTMNHIPALQVGGLIGWNPTKTLSWDLVVKVGIGFDIGEQKTFLGDLNNTVVIRNYEKSGFSTPLVTEADLTLSYQPTTYLNLHVAYQVIYFNGVALAPDQLVKSSDNTPYYEANGAPLIHGLTVGAGWSF